MKIAMFVLKYGSVAMKLRGVIEHITYQNTDKGYAILKARVSGYNDPVTLVGGLADVPVGSVLLCEGEWKTDPKYGSQFVVKTWEEVMPATLYGIEKYLGSGLVKGIGPVYARHIVSRFGLQTLDVIDTDPSRLNEIPGIGKKRIDKIVESWQRQKEIKGVMVFLQGYGVSTAFASRIFRQYGKASVDVLSENPYRLADDIWGIGFKTADSIASKMGYEGNDPRRCRSGIIYTLNKLSSDGHVFAFREQLAASAVELLQASPEVISTVLDEMISSADLITDGDAIYLPAFYHSECGVAMHLKKLMSSFQSGLFDVAPPADSDGIVYDEVQLQAISTAMSSKIMVMTGGPGTGKTTTTKGIIQAYTASGMKVVLAAPTGRAAKRMSEASGMPAKTIHRLLEYNPMDGYKRNEDNPLEGDVLIVDECSMIDLILMYNLVKAIPETMRMVLVGDTDQLPSVGPGNVLRDIIDSGTVPVVRLTRIFRQAMTSRIVMNAHTINKGGYPDISNSRDSDFFFMNSPDPEETVRTIVDLVQRRLPAAYGISQSQIQVLTPMQKGVVGASNLNTHLQQAINPEGDSLSRGGYVFRKGDRVMQIRNNYDKDVFNGDLGYVCGIDTIDRILEVDFDGRRVEYDVSELDEITLAYATTIHKSQGSEYPVVVIPLLMNHYVMLQRNLIYTAVTRAKKICILIGTRQALSYCVSNITVFRRNTRLKERLGV